MYIYIYVAEPLSETKRLKGREAQGSHNNNRKNENLITTSPMTSPKPEPKWCHTAEVLRMSFHCSFPCLPAQTHTPTTYLHIYFLLT